ncbi:MAG TPA: hypothetical protein VK009_05085 [Chloroflexota bacterium]|nr:hypothetical protein [Chloroflexota bacterium]
MNVDFPSLGTPPFSLSETFGHDVTLLPLEFTDGGGLYSEDITELAKELRRSDVDVAYLHEAGDRQWKVLKGEVTLEILIGLGTSVAGSVIVMALSAALAKVFKPKRQVRCSLVKQRQGPRGETENLWFRYDGDVAGLQEALARAAEDEDSPL